MTKIDWNKPIQICIGGNWYDVSETGVLQGYCSDYKVRNKPEPRYTWVNVYSDTLYLVYRQTENDARGGKSSSKEYLHTLKINIDTGETEKVYL